MSDQAHPRFRTGWLWGPVAALLLIGFGGLALVNTISDAHTSGRRWGYLVLGLLQLGIAAWITRRTLLESRRLRQRS